MAQPNGLNPSFDGKVKALGFDATHGNGVSVTVKETNGTTLVNIFGTASGFEGTITGIYLVALDATAANITISSPGGTVSTIAKGATTGAVVGGATLSNTAITIAGSISMVSSVAGGVAGGAARVFITYKVSDNLD